jgi:penicillin-binding protein 1A
MIPQHQLPVDIPNRTEMVQGRVGFAVAVTLMGIVVFLLFLLSVNLGFIFAKSAAALPDIRLLENWRPSESTRIFDRYGNLIANIHGDEDRVVVSLRDISPHMPRAVMAIEDNRFYQHSGVDVRGTFRAIAQNLKGGDMQGGSTLTQQLVKNLFLSPERALTRKIAEAVLALRVEKHYDKNRILELYLNQVYFGHQAYGIEKAARRYFKKPASELTIAESAQLAGLLKAPEGLSPYIYPKAARKRQLEVLGAMEHYGYISHKQYLDAKAEPLHLNHQGPKSSLYPYYVTYVIQELVREFGEDAVRRGGLKVTTTLDQEVQQAAEDALNNEVKRLPPGTGVNQGALVAIDVPSGDLIALVGGLDFEKSQFNNATQARRAAGSTFKPIVYLTGFRLGVITPESPISDRPVSYGSWRPKNWDGRFMGGMNIRRALTLSRNTPTVQIGMKVGIDEILKTATAAGITSRIEPNSSSLLGSSGISPYEMATVYSTFARNGARMTPRAIVRVEEARGKAVTLQPRKREQMFDPAYIAMLNSILVDVVEKGTGKNAMLDDRQVAGKTGTTDQVRDIWFSGFTSDMTCVVWMGNQGYRPLHGVFSSNAAKVWHTFAKSYYEIHASPSLPVAGVETARQMAKATVEESGKPKRKRKRLRRVPVNGTTTSGGGGTDLPALRPLDNGPALQAPD